MAISIEVIEIGDSLGVVLSREVLERLRVDVGDTLYLTAKPGELLISRNAPDSAKKLEDTEQFTGEDRDPPNRLTE